MKTIVVADDYAQGRQLVRAVLEQEPSYLVLEAEDGSQALQLVQEQHPSLVILDRQMPGLTGDQVCVALRADPTTRTIPVVIITGDVGDDVEGYMLAAGATICFQKPIHPRELADIVKQLLSA